MTDSTQGAARWLLALGYAGGAILVVLLLGKGNADALAARTVITALSVLVFGLVAAAGLRAMERPGLESLWGYATLLVGVSTVVLILIEAWSEGRFPNLTRVATMVVISFLLGGGSLMLGAEQEEEDQAIRTTRVVSLFSLLLLGVLTVLSVTGTHIGPRWFGIAATVFLVSAASLPLLRLVAEEDRAGS